VLFAGGRRGGGATSALWSADFAASHPARALAPARELQPSGGKERAFT